MDQNTPLKFILASGSPRRKDLLEKIGLNFTIEVPKDFEEFHPENRSAFELVQLNAEGKATEIAKRHKNAIVLGVDTVGAFEDHILEKPKDREDAKRMLTLMQGTTHEVLTALCLIHAESGQKEISVETTKITFHPLSEMEIDTYLDKEEYEDKAAAYAAQGLAGIFIEAFEGDFNNVVGLPLARLKKELRKFDINLLDIVK